MLNILFVLIFGSAGSGLHGCVWAFSSFGAWGLLFVEVRRLLLVGFSCCRPRALGTWAQ